MNKKILLSILACGVIGTGFLVYSSVLAVSPISTYQISFTGANTNPDADINASDVYVVYERGGSIYYKMKRGAEQLIATGTNPDLAVDSAGVAHVAYLSGGNVMYTKLVAGVWSDPTIIAAGDYATIDTDSSNNVHIAYSVLDAGYSDIYYSVNGAPGTIISDLDGGFISGLKKDYTNPVIKIDLNSNYHIAYLYNTLPCDPNDVSVCDDANAAKYVRVITNAAQGNSTCVQGNCPGPSNTGVISKNSLALDDSNNAHIVYVVDSSVIYAKVTTENSWDTGVSPITSNGSQTSVAVNGSTVDVAYVSNGNIKYKEDTGSGFGSSTIINPALNNPASNPVLVLGSNKYFYYENSGNIWLTTGQLIADSNPPVVTGVTEGGIYNTDKTITFTDDESVPTATLDGVAFASGDTVSVEGAHILVVTDGINTVTINFIIDKTPPTITGVTEGETYTSKVTITFSDAEGPATALLEGPSESTPTSPFNVSTNGSWTLTVTDAALNTTIVHFTIKISTGGGGGGATYYTVSASAGTNGSISPTGSTSVASGSSQTYTITPDTGYQIADVLVDNVSVGAVATYTFDNITGTHTISATFSVAVVTTKIGDMNGDGKVDIYDFAIMMSQWGQNGSNLSADLNNDGIVDIYDFAILMANWGL